jgi:hypothetical protein
LRAFAVLFSMVGVPFGVVSTQFSTGSKRFPL